MKYDVKIRRIRTSSFFAEIPATAGQTNTLHIGLPDRAGNMGYAVKDHWVPPAASGTASTATYAYDTAGNTVGITNIQQGISNVEMELGWDERYRLKSVKSAQSVDVFYEYDVLNRRTSRIEGGTTNLFVYDGNQIAADLDGTGNLLRTYVWGTGIDHLLSFTDHTTSNTYYAIKDHLNSVIALVDQTGSIVETYTYDAYGNTAVFDASDVELAESAVGNRYTFQGREIDWATDLTYFRARWYDPSTGRWLSKDPKGLAGGLNLYVAFANNPVNFTDPFGLEEDDDWIPDWYDDLMEWLDQFNQFGDVDWDQLMNDWFGDLPGYNQWSDGDFDFDLFGGGDGSFTPDLGGFNPFDWDPSSSGGSFDGSWGVGGGDFSFEGSFNGNGDWSIGGEWNIEF